MIGGKIKLSVSGNKTPLDSTLGKLWCLYFREMIKLSTSQLMPTKKVLNMAFACMIGANQMWPELKFTMIPMTSTGQSNVFWINP